MRDIMTDKRNKWLQGAMRQCELEPHMRTEELYVPKDKTLADMDVSYLKRQLCHAAQGDMCICNGCPAPCVVGKLLRKAVVGG